MAAEFVAQLRSGDKSERQAAYTRLLELEAEDFRADGSSANHSTAVEIAVACALPLLEVLCRPVGEVDVAEFHRASQVLAALSGLDPARVGGECSKPNRPNQVMCWTTPDNAFGAVLAKEPASLSAEDARTVAWAEAAYWVQLSLPTGAEAVCNAAGITFAEYMPAFSQSKFMLPIRTPSDDRPLVIVPQMLELIREPAKLPDFMLVGVLSVLQSGLVGRPAVAAVFLKLGGLAALMQLVRARSPGELVAIDGFSRWPHGCALLAIKDLVESSQAGGVDLTAELLSCGFIDVMVSALSAVEEIGAENAQGVLVVMGILHSLLGLDGQALPQIEDKLRAIPSALRYVRSSKLAYFTEMGMSASTFATIVAANLWGKDEDNEFGFARTYYKPHRPVTALAIKNLLVAMHGAVGVGRGRH